MFVMSDFKSIPNEHFACQYAGQTLKWCGTDSLTTFQNNIKTCKDTLEQLGWLDPDVISYKFNSYGFREEEFDNSKAGIALGCSLTSGIGLPLDTVWPSVLSKKLNTKIWNLGVGGSSADTAFRLLDNWLPQLNAKFVIFCIPPNGRFEVHYDDIYHTLGPWGTDHLHTIIYKRWILSDQNIQINLRKNILSMKQLCFEKNIPFISINFDGIDTSKTARDLLHVGIDGHKYIAEQAYNLLLKSTTV